jgi:hypothetical protein
MNTANTNVRRSDTTDRLDRLDEYLVWRMFTIGGKLKFGNADILRLLCSCVYHRKTRTACNIQIEMINYTVHG